MTLQQAVINEGRTGVAVKAIVTGMLVLFAGTIPRNVLVFANLRFYSGLPWAIPVMAMYLWCFWSYLNGAGPPVTTAAARRAGLRANRLSGRVWAWALLAGGIALVALVIALRLLNRLIELPPQQVPEFHAADLTIVSLLVMSAPIAGVVEEAAFRGYMQGPLERLYGMPMVILITGTMFAVAHLDFTWILWPYYVAVAAIYGTVTHLTNSILPAVVLHTLGNIYSNLYLWLYGQAEWQAGAGQGGLIWQTGIDNAFWHAGITLLVTGVLALLCYFKLATTAKGITASH